VRLRIKDSEAHAGALTKGDPSISDGTRIRGDTLPLVSGAPTEAEVVKVRNRAKSSQIALSSENP